MSTSHNRRRAVRARMAETGESYTEALRAIESGPARPAPPFGGATPPADWTEHAARCPAIAALWRDQDGDGREDEIAVYDRASGALLDYLVVPHVPEQAHAAYVEHYVATRCGRPGSPAERTLRHLTSLGRPDLLVHRLGYQAHILCTRWQQWPDGSWRVGAEPTVYTHSVTATAERGGVRLVVVEHPDTVIMDELVTGAIDSDGTLRTDTLRRALDRHGMVIDRDVFSEIGIGTLYQRARRGHLAERDWRTLARVRLRRDVTAESAEGGRRTFREGEIIEVRQWGPAGHQVSRRSWWTSSDLDYTEILSADDVEVVEVLEDRPPTYAAR